MVLLLCLVGSLVSVVSQQLVILPVVGGDWLLTGKWGSLSYKSSIHHSEVSSDLLSGGKHRIPKKTRRVRSQEARTGAHRHT